MMLVLEQPLTTNQEPRNLARRFEALADETSVQMLRVLAAAPATCTELAERFHCCLSMAWQRLAKLVKAGFVERHGHPNNLKYVVYVVNVEEINAFLCHFSGYVGMTQAFSYENAERPGLS